MKCCQQFVCSVSDREREIMRAEWERVKRGKGRVTLFGITTKTFTVITSETIFGH